MAQLDNVYFLFINVLFTVLFAAVLVHKVPSQRTLNRYFVKNCFGFFASATVGFFVFIMLYAQLAPPQVAVVTDLAFLVSAYFFLFAVTARVNQRILGFKTHRVAQSHLVVYFVFVIVLEQFFNDWDNRVFLIFVLLNIVGIYSVALWRMLHSNDALILGDRLLLFSVGFSVVAHIFLMGVAWVSPTIDNYFGLTMLVYNIHYLLAICAIYAACLGDVVNKYEHDTIFDPLTHLKNYRYFREQLKYSELAAQRYEFPISLVRIDIDDYEEVSKIYGLAVGDKLIQRFAEVIKEYAREGDVLARIENEQFFLLLPHVSADKAEIMALRIRDQANLIHIDTDYGTVKFTVSIGLENVAHDVSIEQNLANVELALSQAKSLGRNFCVIRDKMNRDDLHSCEQAV